jgi:hypothetical protein
MSTYTDFLVPLTPLVLVAAAIAAAVTLRLIRARRSPRQRVVEKPNSHYTSQLVRNGETRHQWQNIALDRVHEVNRGEVVRLLAQVEAGGVDTLRPSERTFLDRVAELAGTEPPVQPRDTGGQIAPELRHRPA